MALRGLKVIELAGLAPGPMCGMILSDFGADVVVVDRISGDIQHNLFTRGKRALAVDLKRSEGVDIVKKLCEKSDVLIEPFRKGVMEKLGLGPVELMRKNPALIYSRLTGYGQNGPLSERAGHDINYLAVSGVLSTLGRKNEKPTPPINLLADFAGGSLTCIIGILLALHERKASGQGQVIDSSMVEGAAYLSTFLWASRGIDVVWKENGARGENLLDGGAVMYDTYETKDGLYVAVGPLEPQFFAALVRGLGLAFEDLPDDLIGDQAKKVFAKTFKEKNLDEWQQIFDKTDACVSPVVDWDKVLEHPHNLERESFNRDPLLPLPAPRLSRTPGIPKSFSLIGKGQHSVDILEQLGYASEDIKNLLKKKIVYQGNETSKL